METAFKPLVSIIIPCYNSESWVSETIDSCLQQTYPNLEIIVVNDGSIDGSADILHSYQDRIIVIHSWNRGLPAARNLGVQHSKGEYLLFLDADDLLAENTIDILVSALYPKHTAFAVCNWCGFIDENNQRIITEIGSFYEIEGDLFINRFTKWFMPTHSVLWPRSMFEDLGGWNESLLNYHDYELEARAILSGAGIIRVNDGCALYRRHTTHTSSSGQLTRDHIISRINFCKIIEREIQLAGRLAEYSFVIRRFYASIAISSFGLYDDLYAQCLNNIQRLGGFDDVYYGKKLLIVKLLGFSRMETLIRLKAKLGFGNVERKQLYRTQQQYKPSAKL